MGFSRSHKVHPFIHLFHLLHSHQQRNSNIYIWLPPLQDTLSLPLLTPLLSHPVRTPFVSDHRHSTAVHALAVFQMCRAHFCTRCSSCPPWPSLRSSAQASVPRVLFPRSAQQLLNYCLFPHNFMCHLLHNTWYL